LRDTILNYSVLFVEDDMQVREKVSSRLKRHFKNVYVASDGEEGWSLYLQHKPNILFLDIDLPKLSGIELLKRVRESDYSTKAVMLTAHSDLDFLLSTNQLKLTKYIVKPLSREVLNSTIEMLVKEMTNFKIISLKNLALKSGYQWNFENSELSKEGNIIHLTSNERKLLECFVKNINITLSFDDIIILVWNSFDADKRDTLKTLVKTLRNKLPEGTIENVFGVGYRMDY